MKKIISSALLLLCACMAVNAASFKFYINPGHGGHDSDDRPTPQPLGVAIYYESDGNLVRGKYVKAFLDAMGVANKISRTTNTSADDLNLTYIATLSSNYGGYFWSLHSNGANASANYHIALYKGSNSTNSISPSKAMAKANSDWAYAQNLTNCTYCTARSMADYDLMGWHYGVLRTNTQPGFLVEAWFHDYRPESLRMKSDHYEKFLAWQQVRSAMVSPGGFGTKVLKGCVVGDVRDLSQSCGYTSYTTRGRDSYLALNGAKAELYSGDSATGTPVQTCTTDNCCNGVWGFFDITAGTYTVKISKDGYKSLTKTFTVSNGTQQAWQVSLVKGVDAGISVSSGAVAFGEITAGESSTKTVTIKGQSLTSNITVTNSNTSQFTVTPTSLGTTGGTLTIKYSPATAGSHSATITLKSGSYSAKITATGTAKNPPLTFTEGWNYSETSNKKAAWMENWANYRNMAYGGGKLYVVDNANIVVKVINAQTGAWIKDLDMTGVSGGANKLVDVAYVDGKILGTNIATSAEGMGTLKVYIWDHEDVAPRVLLQTTNLGGMDRIGDAIEVQGNLTSGKICYLGQQTRDYTDSDGNAANGNCNSLVTYAITNGEVSTTPVVADIDAFIAGLSPRAVPDGNNFWLLGQQYHASQISATGELMQSIPATAFNLRQTSDGCGNDFVPFKFNGTQYAFTTDYATVYDSDSNGKIEEADIYATSLLGGRAVLIDGSEGWAVEGLKNSGNYPSAVLSSKTRNTTYSTSICVNVNGSAGVEMWVLVHNQGIAYYKHATAATNTITESTTPLVVSSVNSVAFKTNQGASVTKSIT
ncbi:MAG: N-acetylmuramoyl-L-alanine amidase, partial [Muribaculaceae bacterium]|nr:N-acetylmuramoyl-L-alanine amidase [Muribaculaceae bacterium]